MNKKIIFLTIILFILCFSAGLFTQIVIPKGALILNTLQTSLTKDIFSYIKGDILIWIAIILSSLTVYTMPIIAVLAVCKTFSLGFSAAYLLSTPNTGNFVSALCILLPRGLFKIPAIALLLLVTLKLRSEHKHHNPRKILKIYLGLLFLLILSSLIEVFLLHAFL